MKHNASGVILDRVLRARWLLAAVASMLFAAAGAAQALWVDSGLVGWSPDFMVPGYGMTDVYLESTTHYDDPDPGVYNSGLVQAGVSLPAGFIGADLEGYRNGGFCGEAEDWNSTTVSWMPIGRRFCTNPSGTQTFKTNAGMDIWNGNGYNGFGWQSSPNLNH